MSKRYTLFAVLFLSAIRYPLSASFAAETETPRWGDNPFLEERHGRPPPADAGAGEEDLTLNGILWDAHSPEAILNGRVLGAGDWIGPWQVVEIQKNRVVVSNGLTARTLEVE